MTENALLTALRPKLFFTIQDIAFQAGLPVASARVLASRYTKKGLFLRLKNNFYAAEPRWVHYTTPDFLRLANFLQVPSYISCLCALAYHEITTQVPRNFWESASLKRTATFSAAGHTFTYYKLPRALYSDFTRTNGLFLASAEKALADAMHLAAFGKYRLDTTALDLQKLDRKGLLKIIRKYPPRTREKVKQLCRS